MIEQKTEQERITLTLSIPVETHERLVGIARLTGQDVSGVIDLMTEFYGMEYVKDLWEIDNDLV